MNTRLKLALGAILLTSLACTAPFEFTFGDSGPRVRGSGDEITLTPNVSGFDSLEIGHAFEVDIIQSQTYSLAIDIDDNLEEYLIVDDSGGTLVLALEEGRNYTNVTLRAQISMPELSSLELSGASNANFTQFNSSSPFDLKASGASEVSGDIKAGDVSIEFVGGQRCTIDR